MDIQQLEMILQALSTAGEGTLKAFVFYMAYDLTKLILILAAVLSIVVFVSVRVFDAINKAGENTEAMKSIRDLLGIGVGGYVTESERRHIMVRIRKLLERGDENDT